MNREQIQQWYDRLHAGPYAMSAHMLRLKSLAEGLDVVEFGVGNGCSTSAFLLSAKSLVSYDLSETPAGRQLKQLAGDGWQFLIGDSRAAQFEACDLLLIDSLHTYEQVWSELAMHGHKVRRYLVFHDVVTFGSYGARGERGEHSWLPSRGGLQVPFEHLGIRPAIDAYMVAHPEWRIAASYWDSHGLLVLERG